MVEDLIKKAILDEAKKEIIKAVLKTLPFFSVPPFSFFIGWVLDFILNKIYISVWTAIKYAVIDIQIDAENSAYVLAIENLKKLKEGATNEEIEKAKQDFKNTFRDLVKFK